MTEPNEAPPAGMPERGIDFRDRHMVVRIPSPEQLLVWKRTLSYLQKAETTDWAADEVMKALERTRKIIDSVLVHEVDRDWLDDQMLEGNLGLIETAQIIQLTTEAFAAEGNHEDRRAAKKTTRKTARKKAP